MLERSINCASYCEEEELLVVRKRLKKKKNNLLLPLMQHPPNKDLQCLLCNAFTNITTHLCHHHLSDLRLKAQLRFGSEEYVEKKDKYFFISVKINDGKSGNRKPCFYCKKAHGCIDVVSLTYPTEVLAIKTCKLCLKKELNHDLTNL